VSGVMLFAPTELDLPAAGASDETLKAFVARIPLLWDGIPDLRS
jgi:hypothetical protein